ncbi:MAG TPA: hypothetical protein PKI20_21315 [Verrucomicrobiota bacterium]|nr:hypothetical protein [Verrucomicrobiota bacterium]HQL80304.1 hypothetical protein [Verrucomicrobiota bacterium]
MSRTNTVALRGLLAATFSPFKADGSLNLPAAFARGDMEAARREQMRCVRLIRTLAGIGFFDWVSAQAN